MIRAVVIRAAGNGYWQMISTMIRQHQQIGSRLGCGIGTGSMDRRTLCKEQVGTIQRQVAINFVRRHLMIALNAVFPAGIQQNLRTHDIGSKKHFGVLNGAVYMGFCGKIYDIVRFFRFKQVIYQLSVCNIPLDKLEFRVVHDRLQRFKVARIGQRIQTDDLIVGMVLALIKHEIAADKPGAAGHDQFHSLSSVNKVTVAVAEQRRIQVFLRKNRVFNAPCDTNLRIVKTNGAVTVRRVKVVDLIDKLHIVRQR